MVKEQKINAIITDQSGKYEVRCGYCGKKLLEFEKKFKKNGKKVLTNHEKYATIQVKCSRCAYTNSFHI